MFMQIFNNSIGKVTFTTDKEMRTEEKKEYAMRKLNNGSYQNCTIGKVYVNGELVLENVKVI